MGYKQKTPQELRKKILGTAIFASLIAAVSLTTFAVAQAASNGHGSVHTNDTSDHGYGVPSTPPPGQVNNTNSQRGGTPGLGRGK